MAGKDQWSSKIGIILAVAGSAVGLGNFIRFPNVVASNGGGAFMIPYFVAFLLIGIPMAWVEWTLGRWGGQHGVNSGPAIFQALSGGSRKWKFLGFVNVLSPLLITFYYVVIESVILAYAWYSLIGAFNGMEQAQVGQFLGEYISGGGDTGEFISSFRMPIVFFILTFAVNYAVIYNGIKGGIEKVSLYGMPLLGLCALILFGRVLTLGFTSGAELEATLGEGFNFFWEPQFEMLLNPDVWLEAAGQIFFSLSLGLGAILTYSTYLPKNKDVALGSVTASATNSFAEVIIGGSIIVPAAVMFFGVAAAEGYAGEGTFTLGFIVMPQIFQQMAGGQFFAVLWYGLLFIAGITSSVSLLQPVVAYAQNEFGLNRAQSVTVIGAINFVVSLVVLFGFAGGMVDELDFWAANFWAPISALLLLILFGWVIGIDKSYDELCRGAKLPVPTFMKVVIRFVTPAYILILIGGWIVNKGMTVSATDVSIWAWAGRGVIALSLVVILLGIALGRDHLPRTTEDRA